MQNTIVLSDPTHNSFGSWTLTLLLVTATADIAYIKGTKQKQGEDLKTCKNRNSYI